MEKERNERNEKNIYYYIKIRKIQMMKTREIQFTTLNQEQKLEGGEDQKDKEQPVRHSKEEKKTKCKKETNMIHRGNIR